MTEKMILEQLYRYSVRSDSNHYVCGGVVIANSKEDAKSKARDFYVDDSRLKIEKCTIIAWLATDDDFYNKNSPLVIECYS
jgi:hypothetical protein